MKESSWRRKRETTICKEGGQLIPASRCCGVVLIICSRYYRGKTGVKDGATEVHAERVSLERTVSRGERGRSADARACHLPGDNGVEHQADACLAERRWRSLARPCEDGEAGVYHADAGVTGRVEFQVRNDTGIVDGLRERCAG